MPNTISPQRTNTNQPIKVNEANSMPKIQTPVSLPYPNEAIEPVDDFYFKVSKLIDEIDMPTNEVIFVLELIKHNLLSQLNGEITTE